MRKSVLLRSAAAFCLILTLLFSLPLPAAHAVCVKEFIDPWDRDYAPLTEQEREENLRVITAYLREEMELQDSIVAAILANMFRESALDPRAIDPTGCFFGLCQWSKTRWTNCFAFCRENGLDRFTVEAQLAFLRYELEGEYAWIMDDYLRPVENDEDGAQDAQYYFCEYFEAPLDPEWEQVIRSKYVANIYWPLLSEGDLARPEDLAEEGERPADPQPTSVPRPPRRDMLS